MAGKTDAKEIEIKAKVGGSDIHPTIVVLLESINSVAQGSITYIHKSSDAKSSATDITSADIFKAMGERQTKSFTDTPDTTSAEIKLKDSEKGSVEFKGTTSAPTYAFSAGSVDLSELVQPDYAVLNSLDLTCYPVGTQDIDEVEENPPDSIAEYIDKLMDLVMEKGAEKIEDIKGKVSKESAKKQDQINQKVKKFAKELFKNSVDTFGWDGVTAKLKESGGVKQLKERILSSLTIRGGGFFNNIIRLAEEFQCVYVPEFDNVGKLINRKKLFEDKKDLKLHIIQLHAHAGSVGMFPVRGVAVVGVPLITDYDEVESTDTYHALYPEDVGDRPGGSMMQVQGPQWLPSSGWSDDAIPTVKNGKSSSTVQKNKMDAASAKTAVDQLDSNTKEQKENKEHILKDWAENEYYWQALGQSYADITTELNVTPELGKCYSVKGDKGAIFTGILSSVQHKVMSSVDNCTAETHLHFSHVIMGSAKIPGID